MSKIVQSLNNFVKGKGDFNPRDIFIGAGLLAGTVVGPAFYFTYWGNVERHERWRFSDLWTAGLSPLDVDPEKIKLLEKGKHHHLAEEKPIVQHSRVPEPTK